MVPTNGRSQWKAFKINLFFEALWREWQQWAIILIFLQKRIYWLSFSFISSISACLLSEKQLDSASADISPVTPSHHRLPTAPVQPTPCWKIEPWSTEDQPLIFFPRRVISLKNLNLFALTIYQHLSSWKCIFIMQQRNSWTSVMAFKFKL